MIIIHRNIYFIFNSTKMNNIEEILLSKNNANIISDIIAKCDNILCYNNVHERYAFACKNCDSIICCYCTYNLLDKCLLCADKKYCEFSRCILCGFEIELSMCWDCGKIMKWCYYQCHNNEENYMASNNKSMLACYLCKYQ